MNPDDSELTETYVDELLRKVDQIREELKDLPYIEDDPYYVAQNPHTGVYDLLMDINNPTKQVTRLLNVHPATACALRPCAIHDCPSGHPLAEAPLVWAPTPTANYGLYRECPHGQYHPDVDAAVYVRSIGKEDDLVHECDGCCHE